MARGGGKMLARQASRGVMEEVGGGKTTIEAGEGKPQKKKANCKGGGVVN